MSKKPIDIVNRKDTGAPKYHYSVETQNPDKSWSLSIATDQLPTAMDFARYQRDDRGATVRIVDETNKS